MIAVYEFNYLFSGIIDNLLYLIDQVGHIPTSSKCYYEGRTKPPLLAYIFNLFLRYTGDFEYIKSNVKVSVNSISFLIINII